MKNALYAIVFVLALAAAYAVSQTESPAKPPETAAPPAGQQATQPASDSTTSKTQDEPQNQTPAAPDSAHPDASAAATSDSGIQKQIEQQLASQKLNGVAVAVNNGIVTLTGSVPAKEDRKRAKELAKAVPGVRKVDEKLEIKSPSASAASGGHIEQASAQAPNTAGSIAGNTTAASGTQAPSATQSTTTTTSPSGAASSTSSTQSTQSTVSGATGSATNPQTAQPTSQPSTLPAGGGTGPATSTTTQSSGTATTGGTSGSVTGAATSTTPQAGGTTTSTQSGVGAGTNPPTSTATTTGTVATSAEGTDLQPQIQRALQSEPTLSSSSVTVSVTGDTIELSGTVPTGKEKQTAKRIAQSFAGNRKVVDRITVTGRGVQNAAPPASNNAAPPQTPR
jgi:osmotically-inducible protein OsmY